MTAAMKDFRELDVLHAAHDLVVEIHDISQSFPDHDAFGVTQAIAAAALGIPRSIVHACGRGSDADLKQGLEQASGYTSELEYLMLLASEIGIVDDETIEELVATLSDFKTKLNDALGAL
jgi:four helix bundle protein